MFYIKSGMDVYTTYFKEGSKLDLQNPYTDLLQFSQSRRMEKITYPLGVMVRLLLLLLLTNNGCRVGARQCVTPALLGCRCMPIEMNGLFLLCDKPPFVQDNVNGEALRVVHIVVKHGLDYKPLTYNVYNWPRLDSIEQGKIKLECYHGKCRVISPYLLTSTPSLNGGDNMTYTQQQYSPPPAKTTLLQWVSSEPDVARKLTSFESTTLTTPLDNWTLPTPILEELGGVHEMKRETYFIIGFGCSILINMLLLVIIIYMFCRDKTRPYNTTNTEEIEMDNV
jgi:hypothetical protein